MKDLFCWVRIERFGSRANGGTRFDDGNEEEALVRIDTIDGEIKETIEIKRERTERYRSKRDGTCQRT